MKGKEELSKHLKTRFSELSRKKAEGNKIVGYLPGGFVPVELIRASGAIPVCLLRGGDPEPVMEALQYLTRFLDSFWRGQIGYWALGEDPLYHLPDLIIAPITDCHTRATADCFDCYTDIPVFRIGVPHDRKELAFNYYFEWLNDLKDKLEEFTGNKITEEKLREEIKYSNRVRELLSEISILRKDVDPVISSKEFVWWNHASMLADKDIFLKSLEELHDDLKENKPDSISKGPRLMLVASTMAMGDVNMYDIIEDCGGEFVYEEVQEGVLPYQSNVELNGGDPMKALAEKYLMKRILAPWDRPWGDRMDRLIASAKEYKVDGIVWYQLMYRDSYDMQAFSFEKKLRKETSIPFIKVESDYNPAEQGPTQTRLETFLEIVRGG
jgi:benzoyl-CoA reductase/2-hydroxyglutaryl-CoA dehydratase subunit BcrC/BadD/HgdB